MTIKSRLNKLAALSFLFLLSSQAKGELTKTYPTSPVTTLRMETYLDAIASVYKSSYTVQVDTWTEALDHYRWVKSSQTIHAYNFDVSISTYKVFDATYTIQAYSQMVSEEAKFRALDKVLDQIEIYMVWPDTSPAQGWKGWCLGSQKIPIPCP